MFTAAGLVINLKYLHRSLQKVICSFHGASSGRIAGSVVNGGNARVRIYLFAITPNGAAICSLRSYG